MNPKPIIRPSTLSQALICPPSVRMNTLFPNRGSEYANEGTAAHKLLELCLRDGKRPYSFVGTELDIEGGAVLVTAEMASCIEEALDFIETQEEFVFSIETEKSAGLSKYGLSEGTIDVTLRGMVHTYIIDYKHGAGVAVDVEDNAQLMAYALPEAEAAPNSVIKLVIIQPRAGGIKVATVHASEILGLLPRIQEAWGKIDDPNAFNPHIKACQFCNAKGHCSALRTVAEDWMYQAKGLLMFGEFKELDTMKLAELAEKAELVQSWAKGVRDAIKNALADGKTVPGYVLEQGAKGHRRWISEPGALQVLTNLLGQDAYAPVTVIPPAQAEKKLGKKIWAAERLDELITRPVGEPKVKKVDVVGINEFTEFEGVF